MIRSEAPASAVDGIAFGSALARQRREYGWSQSELARRLAEEIEGRVYSQTTVSQWERGHTEVPEEVREALFRLFGDLRQDIERAAGSSDAGPARPDDLPDADLVNRRLENFELWRSCVRLDDTFPELEPYCSKPFLNLDRERQVRQLVEFTASGSGPSVVVSFASGHGITTFYRHVFRRVLTGDVRSSVIPVPLSLADIADRDGTLREEGEVIDAIRRRLLYALALKPSEGRGKADGIGAWAESTPFGLGAELLLDRTVSEPPGDFSQLEGEFVELGLAELIRILADRYMLYVSVQVDVSSSPQQAMTADLRRAIPEAFEAITEVQMQLREATDTTFSIVAFATRDDEPLIKSALIAPNGGLANPEVLKIRSYAPFEVFVMLMNRYGEDLATKLNSGILVGMVGPDIPLWRTQRLLQEYVLQWFNAPDLVPYAIGTSVK